MSSEEREPRAKLNMEHGFIQSIIKNQVDRDDYDKEQRLMKVQNKISGSPSRRERPKRAALQVYVPPHLRGKTSTNTETSPPKGKLNQNNAAEKLICYDIFTKILFMAGNMTVILSMY